MRDYIGCWLASAAFAMDRITKGLAAAKLREGFFDALPGILRFTYVENTGAAFGLFDQHTSLIVLMTAATVVGLIAFLIVKGASIPRPARYALWLLAGGAIGNFVDRLFLGYVIDFLELRFVSFPVFNIADCCVSVASVFLLVFILLHKEAQPSAK